MDQFAFNPAGGFTDSSAFPNPNSEAETRTQLNELHTQTRDFINTIVIHINAMDDDILALQSAVGDPDAVAEILAAIQAVSSFLAVADTVTYVGES